MGATYDVAFEWETLGEPTENGYLLLNAAANADQGIDEIDFANNERLLQVQGAVPGIPSNPLIAPGTLDVSLLPTLDWDDSTAATGYHIFIWKASEARPDAPTASGLAASQYIPAHPLDPATAYLWQVVSINEAGESIGEEWLFTTKALVPGDMDDSGSVNLADAVLALKVAVGLEIGTVVYEAADVNGDGKIGLAEAAYALRQMAGLP